MEKTAVALARNAQIEDEVIKLVTKCPGYSTLIGASVDEKRRFLMENGRFHA